MIYVDKGLYLILLIGITHANPIKEPIRIIGGIASRIEQYPYQVSIRSSNIDHCGGAIISEWHVLTAAHCIGNVLVPPFKDISVHTATSSVDDEGHTHKIASIEAYPEYKGDADQQHHDIAVITLADPIVFDRYQKKIELASSDVIGGESAVATGWGYTSAESLKTPVHLQMVEMSILKISDCRERITIYSLFEEQVCAFRREGAGTCMGDSGGPLVVNGKLVGVTSWGIPCGRGYPDVFTKVYAYKDFIESVMQKRITVNDCKKKKFC